MSHFGRTFMGFYNYLRDQDWDPMSAFNAALSSAAQEVEYTDWPLPREWISEATEIAIHRDGDAFWESRRRALPMNISGDISPDLAAHLPRVTRRTDDAGRVIGTRMRCSCGWQSREYGNDMSGGLKIQALKRDFGAHIK